MSESAAIEGARLWLIPDGFVPEESSGSQESHEAICVLNTSLEEARLSVSFYFENRDPIKNVAVVVPAERTRHIRTDDIDGVEIPRGVPYAIRVESSVPVTVQCSRMDTTQPALSLMTAMAYPVKGQ
ncbi:MAG TPA: sensory rhodopsin transducer [Rubrobacteraceae bacterium]|nr:sensory rhodopsin transducer [Rubrobacteraceae bacterium]